MAPRIVRHPRTRENILDEYLFIAVESPHASEAAAERFLDCVETTLATLASMPAMGHEWPGSEAVGGLRVFAVKEFENWLIFYTALPDGIFFRLLIHGARDLPRHLGGLGGDGD